MFVTPLNFPKVLDRFYHQDRFELMLLFVSSFDGRDETIIQRIVENATRIDRITGLQMCFFYFIKDIHYSMNDSLVRWIKDIPSHESLYGEGVSITMETADDICREFGLLRSNLPAFILISKREKEPYVFSIQDYNDFESFLTPLNILHSYIEDRDTLISNYENSKKRIITDYYRRRRQTVVTQSDVDKRRMLRICWEKEITRQIRKKEKELLLGEVERAQKRESAISKLRQNLADNPELIVTGEDESVLYPQEELDNVHYPEEQLKRIKCTAIQRMDIALNSHEGENIITSCINGRSDYVLSVLKIMELLKTKDVRISRIIERIRYEIHKHGFNVFISCKSQDYELAYELYDYLAANGFKPFLADASFKEVGIDQYTAVIGEVINVCQNMVVFATDVDYLKTPYVKAEWHLFVNDINTGYKPDAKIVNVLSPDIDVHSLPSWLRDKQCLTITEYKNDLLHFLENHDNNAVIQELIGKIRDKRSHFFQIIDKLHFECRDEEIDKQIHALCSIIDRKNERLSRLLQELNRSNPREIRLVSCEVEDTLDYLENETQKLFSLCQHNQEQEKVLSCYISDKTRGVSCASQPRGNSPFKMMRTSSDNRLEESFLPLIPQNDTFAIDKKVNYKQGFFNCLKRIFGRNRNGSFFSDFSKAEELEGVKVKSSVFAPYEVASGQHMLVQVYLHLPEETEAVISLASEADMNAVRRGYESLDIKLKEGDEVGIELNVCSDTLLLNSRKSVIWHGSYVKRAFDFIVPSNLTADELSSTVNIYVNGAYAGEMIFLTNIVSSPRSLYTNVLSKMPRKLFVSYSHKDVQTAERIAKIHEALGIDVFFDKHRLKAGYIFSEEIFEFIHSSDTFLLCWSENAKGSDYVQKERHEAMSLAYPWFKPRDKAPLKILTYTIEPHTTPPDDMKKYFFENL